MPRSNTSSPQVNIAPPPLRKCDTPAYQYTTMSAQHTTYEIFSFIYIFYKYNIKAHNFQTEIQRRKIKKDTMLRRLKCTKYIYEAYSESKYIFAIKNRISFVIKFYCYQILHSLNCFSTYSLPLMRHLS